LAPHRKLPGGRIYRGVAADAPLAPLPLHMSGGPLDHHSNGALNDSFKGAGQSKRKKERPAPHAAAIPEPIVLGHPRAVEALRLSARQGHLSLVEGEINHLLLQMPEVNLLGVCRLKLNAMI